MHAPEQMPDPWLFDSRFLLAELARVRELILRIPLHLDTHGPANTAVAAVYDLEDRLRFILAVQMESQRAWAKRQDVEAKGSGKSRAKIVKLSAAQAAMRDRAAAMGGVGA
jgi:hypothetical protein